MFQQIMQTASLNANLQFNSLAKVTENVSGMNIPGYKAQRFETYLTPSGVLQGTIRRDMAVGQMMLTKRPLDVAIDGEGYIPVTQPNGQTAYTRDGSLAVNSLGYLVTQFGDMIGNGIQIPVDYDRIEILHDGVIRIYEPAQREPIQVGKLEIVKFRNPEALQGIGYNKFVANKDTGEPLSVQSGTLIRQGKLERANVNMYSQIDQMLRLNATVVSNLRIIKFTDDLYRQSVNLTQ
jgi:flagellar basal-body rod protein FlgG